MGKLSETALKRLIQGGESNTVELKVAAPRATEMAERLCGLANAQGGLVIIGVRDSTHEIVGVPDRRIGETLDVISRAVRQMIKPELVLDPAEPEIYAIEGKNVIVSNVRPSSGPVYQAHGIYWIRRGTHTVSLNLTELLEVANDRGLLDWEHQPVRHATMEDMDLEKVRSYLAQRSANTRQTSRFENIERVLLGMGCAATTSNGIVPTNAGLVFFGHHPQEHIVQADVACVLFRETIGASRRSAAHQVWSGLVRNCRWMGVQSPGWSASVQLSRSAASGGSAPPARPPTRHARRAAPTRAAPTRAAPTRAAPTRAAPTRREPRPAAGRA